MNNLENPDFVFAYGSLIWRPGFDYDSVAKACVAGFERRFWQASHDHRGTLERPGRVVTLVPIENGACCGLVYRLPEKDREKILADLDHREKDGYKRQFLSLHSDEYGSIRALTWVADDSNSSWRGGDPFRRVANVIAHRHGPSGSNSDYLLNLWQSLQDWQIDDPYIDALKSVVCGMLPELLPEL